MDQKNINYAQQWLFIHAGETTCTCKFAGTLYSPSLYNNESPRSKLTRYHSRKTLLRNYFSDASIGEFFRLKTINRYKQEKKKLNPRNSELILKLLALYSKGIEVFGKLESFNNWLMKPAFGIGNKTPFSLMNTSTGIDLIFEELIRIEYGDLA